MVFNAQCVSRALSNAAILQWSVGSNRVFPTGRLGVSKDDYLSRNNTSGSPDMVFNVWCGLSPHTASVPLWPVGNNVALLTGRLGVSHIMHISRDDYLSRNNTSGSPDMVFNAQCVSRALSNAAIPQWPVGSNVVFLTGRLGVSHIMHISRDDYLSRHNRSGPPDMVFNIWYVSRAPCCCQMQPFLSGRLGVTGCSSMAVWESSL